jgi:hypothetical protein
MQTRIRFQEDGAGSAISGQAAQQRRGPPDRGEHRQAAGVFARIVNALRRELEFTPEHIMASGALRPGFPLIEIGGGLARRTTYPTRRCNIWSTIIRRRVA